MPPKQSVCSSCHEENVLDIHLDQSTIQKRGFDRRLDKYYDMHRVPTTCNNCGAKGFIYLTFYDD